ncbi:MAG: type II toxin-antitoxin system RelB/DinJ family antitoxin [Treponema sp.]|jgi:DNA-damage-inducible protein J|nr:type II toxin-antitoxin system RelB/DinJ family antitoxin [Treponema sp.]
MTKTANLNIRIDPQTKQGAEQLFSTFGITLSDAVSIFLHQSLLEGGLPFVMKQPRYNVETEDAMKEARDILKGKIKTRSYTSAKALADELKAEVKSKC